MKRLLLLSIVLGAFLLVSGCREGEGPAAGPQAQAPAATTKPAPSGPRTAAHRQAKPSGDQERIVLTITLPPASEKLATPALSGGGQDCPQGQVSALLGVEIVSPHGIVIGRVLPEGLGAKAGLKPGDSIIEAGSHEVTCPSAFMPYLDRTDKPREVKLTVLRAKAKPQQEPAAPTANKPAGK